MTELKLPELIIYECCLYLKMADPMRDSGLDLIREYIPNSPVYTPEDEPGQYDIPYVPASPVYPTPAYNPPTPEYIPSLITEGRPTSITSAQ